MPKLQITLPAARLLRAMIVSCGNIDCFEAIKVLEKVDDTIDFDDISKIPDYSYRLKAFERLEKYAEDNRLTALSVYDVAAYFAGDYHISIMDEFSAHAGLARYFGESAGLVTHVLLPLVGTKYINQEYEIEFRNTYCINPDEPGIPCLHLGLVVNVDITQPEVRTILDGQYNNKIFREYLSETPAVIDIPKEYYTALNCLAIRS
jgi:hypothetical protein